MMEYKLARRANACMACERPFPDGATIVSVILAEGEGFQRRDLCESCFAGPGECYSHWRTVKPVTVEERRKLDFDLAGDFLRRLLRDGDPARAGLAYLLALLLARKRRVKLLDTVRLADGETLRVLLPGEEEDETVGIRVPLLDEAATARLQAEIAGLFSDDAGSPAQG